MIFTNVFITIATNNIEKLVVFYVKLLEQKPQKLINNVYAEFQLSSLTLGIFQPQKNHQSEFFASNKSPISLCFEVTNLEKCISDLKLLGYPPVGKINIASHGYEIYAYDPDGNRLILHQSKEQKTEKSHV
ncbi:VOC family protein [Anabaena sp. FACHB-1237]|uniref:VOC family protein n=1 Tax=Anabaena sp. FACHB-1237 TaxID=2692769 RepID=UPI001680595C|nr:VOC family protein [Anabaena sp. FACHB-1237]MBD2138446.1 VOC family protein [Anabaena sp. FACHB-1237]